VIAIELLLYFGILEWFALRAALQRREFFLVLGLPLAIVVMHVTWGSGFLGSILNSLYRGLDPRWNKSGAF
jgi:glucose-6-phosphate-specific signal transduction histidine kinase